jgi:hypothetical protein
VTSFITLLFLTRSGNSVSGKPNNISGDGTVCVDQMEFLLRINIFVDFPLKTYLLNCLNWFVWEIE